MSSLPLTSPYRENEEQRESISILSLKDQDHPALNILYNERIREGLKKDNKKFLFLVETLPKYTLKKERDNFTLKNS